GGRRARGTRRVLQRRSDRQRPADHRDRRGAAADPCLRAVARLERLRIPHLPRRAEHPRRSRCSARAGHPRCPGAQTRSACRRVPLRTGHLSRSRCLPRTGSPAGIRTSVRSRTSRKQPWPPAAPRRLARTRPPSEHLRTPHQPRTLQPRILSPRIPQPRPPRRRPARAGWPAPRPQARPAGHPTTPGHPNPGYSAPGSARPGRPAAAPGPEPGMAMPNPAPPRRRKPRTEPVAYAPVTGSLPLSRDDVTEIPADGPITWPKRSTGIIGVANLVASAVLAVIWAWIPLGLLFTGIGGIFALGLG